MDELKVNDSEIGTRLDVFANKNLSSLTRSAVSKLISNGKILVNGNIEKSGYKIRRSDKIKIDYRESDYQIPKINLPIIYEDDDVIVVDKPAGLLTHSKGVFNPEATIASFIEDKIDPELIGQRSGIVHRLDRDTSGVIICAKNPSAKSFLQRQFSQRKAKKKYLAIVEGTPKHDEAIIKLPIARNPKQPQTFRVDPNGKTAETRFRIIKRNKNQTLVELMPVTGRTHQLRVHMAHLGHPIVGDKLYGTTEKNLMLHANTLEITIPNGVRKTFSSKPPKYLKFSK